MAAQLGQDVRHMRARGERVVAPAVIGNPAAVERLFDGIGLGRQTHQYRDLMKGQAVPVGGTARIHGKETGARNLRLNLGGNEVRLGSLVGENLAKDFASARRNWLQRTRRAAGRAFDDSGGQTHDRRHGTIIASKRQRAGSRIVAGETAEIGRIGTAKTVDRLIGIANRAQIRGRTLGREQADQAVLGGIDVLILVHQQVATATARGGERGLIRLQQADSTHQQIVEIHRARAGESLLIHTVDCRQFGCCICWRDQRGLGRRDGARGPRDR